MQSKQLQEYYENILNKNQVLREKKKTSKVDGKNLNEFSLDIFKLCEDYNKKLPTKLSWYDGELSNERTIQVKLLGLLLNDFVQNIITEDSFYRGIRYVYEHCTVTLILPSDLNDFKSRLKHILSKANKQNTAVDFSTYARLEQFVLAESTGILNKAILNYEEQLKNNSTLQAIEEKLKTVSGRELCIEIIAQIKREGGKKLFDLELELQTAAKEIEENNQKMQQSMQLLTDDLERATEIIVKYQNAYPQRTEEFGTDRFIRGDSANLSSPSDSKKVRFLDPSSPLSTSVKLEDISSSELEKNLHTYKV